MWSVAMIVGVAVACSTVLLIVGITLAVTIERRRYYRFVQRYVANLPFDVHPEFIGDNGHLPNVSDDRRCSTKARMCVSSAIEPSRPPAETPDEDASLASHILEKTPPLAKRKDPRKPLREPIRRKLRKRRRSKKFITERCMMNSPLSAITELSSSSQPSSNHSGQLVESTSALSSDSHEVPLSEWSISVSKTRDGNEISSTKQISQDPSCSETDSSSQDLFSPSRGVVARSISMQSTTFSAPEDPLPPLPGIESDSRSRNVTAPSRASSLSVESVGTSVLGASPVSRKESNETSVSTQAKDLQQFNFDLDSDTVIRMNSPARLTPRGRVDPHAMTVMSLRASVNLSDDGSGLRNGQPRSMSMDAEPKDSATTPQSTTEDRNVFEYEFSNLIMKREPDIVDTSPVKQTLPLLKSRAPPNKPTDRPLSHRSSVGSLGSIKNGHKRQNCVRISNLPVAIAQERPSQQLKIPKIEEEDIPADDYAPNTKSLQSGLTSDDQSKESQQSQSSEATLRKLSSGLSESDSVLTSAPDTSFKWRFGLVPPDTPTASPSASSIVFQNSPILPSPAYTPIGLHPRRSQVRGPRSPSVRGISERPHPLRVRNNTNQMKTQSTSNDLQKSVKILRSMNSENKLLSSDQYTKYNELGEPSNDTGFSPEKLPASISISRSTSVSQGSPSLRSYIWTCAPGPAPAMANNSSLSILHQTHSQPPTLPSSNSSASTWEDASVRNESRSPSPEADIVTPTKPFKHAGQPYNRRDSKARPLSLSNKPKTPQQRASTGITKTLGSASPGSNTTPSKIPMFKRPRRPSQSQDESPTASSTRKKSRIIGLGVTMQGETIVPGTPKSLYDQHGFLKEWFV